METASPHRHSILKRLHIYMKKINLFDEDENMPLTDQLLATRVSLVLLLISLTMIIAVTTFTGQTHSVTIQSPSETTFVLLSRRYPSTLSCPCTQTSIGRDRFLSIDPRYHPICSSQFVNQSFIASLSYKNLSDYYQADYRVSMAAHFQSLTLICRTIEEKVAHSVHEFASEHMTTSESLSPEMIDARMQQLTSRLKASTAANMKHLSDFLVLSIFHNGIYTGLRTNYAMLYIIETGLSQIGSFQYFPSGEPCMCTTDIACVQHAEFYHFWGYTGPTVHKNSLFTVPGLKVGCLPYMSFLHSTLECFYDRTCIDQMRRFVPSFSLVTPLSSSTSRFHPSTTVDELVNQLFIESWNEKSNFSAYFTACAPRACTYSYHRRFNFLYVVVTLISLCGGLEMIVFFCAPLIVKVIRWLQKRKVSSDASDVTAPRLSVRQRVMGVVRQVKEKMISLNVFPWMTDPNDGLYSTRLYIASVISGVVLLLLYTSFSIQLQTITLHRPSLDVYERLSRVYSTALVCPCTQLSVSYSSIMHIEARYHQVCSSDFIRDDRWLLYFRRPEYSVNIPPQDFRTVGVHLFTLLQTLCQMSTETVNNALFVFNQTSYVSPRVLSIETFKTETSSLMKHFRQQTITSFHGLLELVRVSIQLNHFVVFGMSNARMHSLTTDYYRHWRFVLANDFEGKCSCGRSTSCLRPQGFYCATADCALPTATPSQTVPGLFLSCLPVDSLLASSLHCFYNASCVDMLIHWRSFSYDSFLLDPRAANVTPLDPLSDSRFQTDATLESIVSQLFIEQWTNTTNYSSYYHQCAPDQCTYTYKHRFDRAYIIANMLGLVGGLTVALSIFIPPVVKASRRTLRYCRRGESDVANATTTRRATRDAQVSCWIVRLKCAIRTINVYKNPSSTFPSDEPRTSDRILLEQHQQVASRFYIILFAIALIALLITTGLNSRTRAVEVSSPLQSTFETLHEQYRSALSCPCSQVVVPYSHFVSVRPTVYHQACSSELITPTYIDILWGSDEAISFFANVDGKFLSTHLRLLSLLCSLAKKFIEQQREIFSARALITLETLTQQSFQTRVDSLVNSFIVLTPNDFQQTHQYIIGMLHANQLHNLFYANWHVRESSARDGYYMLTTPMPYYEDGQPCSCDVSSACWRSLFMNGNEKGDFPGLFGGCLPVFGLRLSTLECFYDAACIKRVSSLVSTSYTPSPLNLSIDTRFTPVSNVSIGTLIDELFIETWSNVSNYSSYFSHCAPLTCRYTYVERMNVVYMLTTVLGLYGGLTVGLKFVVWYSLCLYWKVRRWFARHQGTVGPMQ